MSHALPYWSVDEYVLTSRAPDAPAIAFISDSKSLCFLQLPSELVFPRQKPRVPAADTASGVANKVVERIVLKRMFAWSKE